ncbi:hypothetical protein FA15DRAFT_753319 [Coprinopsis marcescibilis]|uniref:Uncharacterized protein n=1 Tax=Coprinopsis marcescibilis TaxID=230819 RepID=A0A5C3L7A8_COPMA|nr:hypothetical protein FA15DRAFT_753319 [Coprinopsis marcescibilis]
MASPQHIPVPGPHAIYPLTAIDKLCEAAGWTTAWLVEGTVDAAALEVALRNLTEKWRTLAGRVFSKKDGKQVNWFLRIPLGPLPPDYRTFALTTSTSEVPLSTYVTVPIPQSSTSPPIGVCVDASTPPTNALWEKKDHPLTCFHLTYFPESTNNGQSYTVIGFTRSHGIFDGTGAAMIVNALVSEMQGKEWVPPPLPTEGLHVNPVEEVLEEELARNPQAYRDDCKSYILGGLWAIITFMLFTLKEMWWKKADRRIILLPKKAFNYLVDSVRLSSMDDKRIARLSSGDILAAWIIKTIYSSGVSPNTKTHCTNVASIRALIGSGCELPKAEELLRYPFNAFVPLPYPVLTVGEVASLPLRELASLLAESRLGMSKQYVTSAYKLLKKPSGVKLLRHPSASEEVTISNVSASRILEADWAPVGGKRTLCGYRYNVGELNLVFSNAVYIAGRLSDGTVVLDTGLSKARFDIFVAEVQKLVEAANTSS